MEAVEHGTVATSDTSDTRGACTAEDERTPRAATLTEWVERHPVATAAAVAAVVGLGHVLWIRAHRMPGLLDVDESGYLSNAWRFHEAVRDGGLPALFDEVRRSGTAPLVPLLSTGLLAIGPDEVWLAMSVQAVLLVLAASSVAALSIRLVPAWTAVLAATAFCAFPSVISATQSYWYGLAAATFLGLSLWALLASHRCRGPALWWLTPLLAAMVLSRTMALGFVPGVIGAGLALAWGDRRCLLRLTGAVTGAAFLAAPWYLATSGTTLTYLVSAGYGPDAGQFGTDSPILQVIAIPAELALDSGIAPAVAVTVAVLVGAIRSRRDAPGVIRRSLRTPERRALVVASALGMIALMSTPNRGGWFSLPLLVPLTALGAEAVHRGGRRLARSTTIVLTALGGTFLLSGWWILPYGTPIPFATLYETTLSPADVRFEPANRSEQPDAAASWRAAHERILDTVNEFASGPEPVVVTGNMAALNGNQIQLAARLRGRAIEVVTPDTSAPPDVLAEVLRPPEDGPPRPRALVVVDHDRERFYMDVNSRTFAERAEQDGWNNARTVPLPNGDRVRVLLPPEESG